MPEAKPHKAAFLDALSETPDAPYFLLGYILKDVPDESLCRALQAWRDHLAELADLEQKRPDYYEHPEPPLKD